MNSEETGLISIRKPRRRCRDAWSKIVHKKLNFQSPLKVDLLLLQTDDYQSVDGVQVLGTNSFGQKINIANGTLNRSFNRILHQIGFYNVQSIIHNSTPFPASQGGFTYVVNLNLFPQVKNLWVRGRGFSPLFRAFREKRNKINKRLKSSPLGNVLDPNIANYWTNTYYDGDDVRNKDVKFYFDTKPVCK